MKKTNRKLTLCAAAALTLLTLFCFGCGSDSNQVVHNGDDEIIVETETDREKNEDEIVEEALPTAIIEAQPTVLNFGDVEVGDAKTLSFKLKNTGNISISLNSISFTGDGFEYFKSDFKVGNLLDGSDKDINVTYSPSKVGYHSVIAEIANSSDNDKKLKIQLEGNAIIPVVKKLGVYGAPNGKMDFGTVKVGSAGLVRSISMKNIGTGGSQLAITGIYVDESTCILPGVFTVKLDQEISAAKPYILKDNGVQFDVGILYKPLTASQDECSLFIDNDSDDETMRHFEVKLTGQGAEAGLATNPMPIDFGNVVEGADKTIDVTLKNNAAVTVHINYVTLNGFPNVDDYTVFADGAENVDMPPDSTLKYKIRFSPKSQGTNNGYFRVVSNLQGASILDFPVLGRCAAGDSLPVAKISETSHGPEITQHLRYEKGREQTFFGDGSYDPADEAGGTPEEPQAYRWKWLSKPSNSSISFQPSASSQNVTLVFDVTGDYKFTLEVKDKVGQWSSPKMVWVSVYGNDDIKIEMSFSDGCSGKMNVNLGWQPPGTVFCDQTNATGEPLTCPFPPRNAEGNNYGKAVMLKTSSGCSDGATEIITHTGLEVDGAYLIKASYLEDCTSEIVGICMGRSGASVTINIYLRNESLARYTLTASIGAKGEAARWQIDRINGEFGAPKVLP